MELNLHVKSSVGGTPQVLIPKQYLWDFVEYLGFQRMEVIYTHYQQHFMASFPRITHARVQGLLRDWVRGATHSKSVALCAD